MKNLYLVIVGLLLLNGCGGSTLKLGIRAAEDEKDKPAAALVRKIELTYHDSKGEEKMRQDLSVLGLAQPVSIKSDLLKELNWDDEGVFAAKAYSGEGLLILEGQAHADHNVAEIILSRDYEKMTIPHSDLASELVRNIRVMNVPELAEYRANLTDFSSKKCAVFPKIVLNSSQSLEPTILFESAIKAPRFYYQVIQGVKKFPVHQMSLSLNADGILAFNKSFPDLDLLRHSENFEVHFYSSTPEHYEGCINFSTQVDRKPIRSSFIPGKGFELPMVDFIHGKDFNLVAEVPVLGLLRFENPNSEEINLRIVMHGQSTREDGFNSVCYRIVDGVDNIWSMKCTGSLDLDVKIEAKHFFDVRVYGVAHYQGYPYNSIDRFQNRHFKLFWSARVDGVEGQSPVVQSLSELIP